MAFSTKDVPRSFAPAALCVMAYLSVTWPDAAKATANSRTATLLKVIRAPLSRSSPPAWWSRVDVTLKFRRQATTAGLPGSQLLRA